MTFRDTSADTTLDNANMGTREDFRKWWKDSGIEFASIFETGAAEKGWNARQPEIDALMRMQEEWIKKWLAVVEENDALKAENKRLRKDAERFKGIRKLCGYVEDGSSQSLTITQDDATRTWIIKGGKKEISCGDSLAQAIDAAMSALPDTKGDCI